MSVFSNLPKDDETNFIAIKNPKRTLFLGMLWRWGILIIIIINFIFFPLLIPLANLEKTIENILLGIGTGTAPIAMGFDYILAVIFKWPHILLVNQSCYHQKMSPYHLKWTDINKKEFLFIGCFFIIFGIGLILLGIFV